jgi:pilus assembly protein TadC
MPRNLSLTELLNLRPSPPPRELLIAMFAAASEANMTVDEALSATSSAARLIDQPTAIALSDALARSAGSVDRAMTFSVLAQEQTDKALSSLYRVLAHAEQTGESIAERGRLLFDDLIAARELRITRRAETYPIAMIILMVLIFMPAVLILLVGPSYILLLRVLRGA